LFATSIHEVRIAANFEIKTMHCRSRNLGSNFSMSLILSSGATLCHGDNGRAERLYAEAISFHSLLVNHLIHYTISTVNLLPSALGSYGGVFHPTLRKEREGWGTLIYGWTKGWAGRYPEFQCE
jgi:hypothetical protein